MKGGDTTGRTDRRSRLLEPLWKSISSWGPGERRKPKPREQSGPGAQVVTGTQHPAVNTLRRTENCPKNGGSLTRAVAVVAIAGPVEVDESQTE